MGQGSSIDAGSVGIAPPPDGEPSPSYGLTGQRRILSPVETLAQSVSTMAPTTSPTMTIPLAFALPGTVPGSPISLPSVAFCWSGFASLGSRVIRRRRGPCIRTQPHACRSKKGEPRSTWWGLVSAWALLLAYILTGGSVVGGFINYSNVLLLANTGHQASPTLLAAIAIVGATAIAYRDVKISAQSMLWIEATSVSMIVIVVGLILWHHGLHLDPDQLTLKGVTPASVRLGMVLALFSFVGFESATSLGSEAREPLRRRFPAPCIQSAILTGAVLLVCTYAEVMGFHGSPVSFGDSPAPLRYLAAQAGVRFLGPLIDAGAVVSMFACVLACITAAARVLMLMAHHGLAHKWLTHTHKRNATPDGAVLVVGLLMLLPTAVLTMRGVSGSDIYGWMGSLATYGFITVYGQVTFALPFYLKVKQRLTPPLLLLSIAATLAMVLVLVGTLYPVPAAPYSWLPYLYLAYLIAGLVWFAASRRIDASRISRR